MKVKKFTVITSILAVALLISGCSSTSNTSENLTVTNSGEITALEEISFDWGNINIEGGNLERTFKFRNTGEENLIIKTAATSCMCTTAQVELANGEESPEFGMHERKDWGAIVKPNEEFKVKVVFDPMAHGPQGTGMVQRGVYLLTSSTANDIAIFDAKNKATLTEIKVQGNVLSKADFQKQSQTSIEMSGFKFNEAEYDFGIIKQSGGIVSHEFEFEYIGEEPIKITSTPTSCACTTATISKNEFKKGDKGILTVNFDPNLHEEPTGRFFKTISLITDPKLTKQPEVKIWAEIILDLGPENYKLKEVHKD